MLTNEQAKNYNRFMVEREYMDTVQDGFRSFLACCGEPYYDGSDYEEAKKAYSELVADTDGVNSAALFTGAWQDDPDDDGLDWDVIETNEINEVKPETKIRTLNVDNGAWYGDMSTPEEIRRNWERVAPYWDAIVEAMDDQTREGVHAAYTPCSDLDFLIHYLEDAPDDLIIG